MISREEFIRKITTKFEEAEATWGREDDYSPRVASVVFYLSALRKVNEEPFKPPKIHLEITDFLQRKLDEAFGNLEEGDSELVFRLSEEMGIA